MSAELLEEAHRRLDAGDPRAALELATEARAAIGSSGSREDRWRAVHLVGEALFAMGEIAGARECAGEALRLSQASGDPESLGADLNLLGVIELAEDRHDEGAFLLRRAYDLRAQAGGPNTAGAIESLDNLAAALWRLGQEDEALELLDDVLQRCEESFGENHRLTAECLSSIAVKLGTRPESRPKALELHERALAAAEAAHGPDSQLVGRALANVAAARVNSGDLESAAPLFQRALALHERHYGPESRWTAHVVQMLGEHASLQGRHEDARSAFERALVVRVREAGTDRIETLHSATALCNTLEAIRPEWKDELIALELVLLALHPEHAKTLPGGPLDREQGAELLRSIAARVESRTAPDDALVAARERAAELVEQADAAHISGELAAAASSLGEAVAVLEAACGPRDLSLVEPLQRLTRVRQAAGTENEVLPSLRRIASILADAYGELHPRAVGALAEVYWQECREQGPAGGRETAARIEAYVRRLGTPVDYEAAHAVVAAAKEADAGAELAAKAPRRSLGRLRRRADGD